MNVLLLVLAAIVASTGAIQPRPPISTVGCVQATLRFSGLPRGYHLITDAVNECLGNQLQQFQHGVCNLFVQQMQCSMTINENSNPAIRDGTQRASDFDMPSDPDNHGLSISIPITRGALALGPWQGIYLCEHREAADGDTPRTSVVVITAHGQFASMVSKLLLTHPCYMLAL
jgi:thiamine phosphate synthase YjbQ (UPF0047 family)